MLFQNYSSRLKQKYDSHPLIIGDIYLNAIRLIIRERFPILSSLVITNRDPLMGMEIEVKVAGLNWSKISGSMAKFEPKGTIRMLSLIHI